MNILCISAQHDLKIDETKIKRLVQFFLHWKKVECEEVSIHLVDKKKISHLHHIHFQDPTPTDCISFPIDAPDDESSGYKILGEIFVCPKVALEYAHQHRLSPYKEVSLYIIHGLLHLIGYDDQYQRSASIMRDEEKSAISYLEQKEALI